MKERLRLWVAPYLERFSRWRQKNPTKSFVLSVVVVVLVVGLVVFVTANIFTGLDWPRGVLDNGNGSNGSPTNGVNGDEPVNGEPVDGGPVVIDVPEGAAWVSPYIIFE